MRMSDVRLSVVTIRRDRPDYTWAELASIQLQRWDPRDYEIIMLDDSTTTALPEVVRQFRDAGGMPIRFVHFHGWMRSPSLHVGPNGRRSIALHLNYGLRMARGTVILLVIGEFLHIGQTLHEMTDVHQTHSALIYHGCVRDLRKEIVEDRGWIARHETASLRRQEDAWRTWFVHPVHAPLHEEFVFSSMRAQQLRWIGGFDERFLAGLECELGESARRLARAGCVVRYSDQILAGHIEHSRTGRDLDPSNYRAAQRARRLMDQGYWETNPKVKYYRPGTEKRPIRANADGDWGTLPPGVEVWSLEETLQRLPDGVPA